MLSRAESGLVRVCEGESAEVECIGSNEQRGGEGLSPDVAGRGTAPVAAFDRGTIEGSARVERARADAVACSVLSPESACRRLQCFFRERERRVLMRRIESEWKVARGRECGSLKAHVLFLQWVFRASRVLSDGCWQRGSAGVRLSSVWRVLSWLREWRKPSCRGARGLATGADFDEQAEIAERACLWYETYVVMLRRMSGCTPSVVGCCCGGGGDAEGVRRAGGSSVGIDCRAQPDFVRRFGSGAFVLGDAMDWTLLQDEAGRPGVIGAMAGPPCKWYSRLRRSAVSREPPRIDLMRDALQEVFPLYSLENVEGAAPFLTGRVTRLDGPMFGLRVFRARLFETNFELRVDECLEAGAAKLRERCCLGPRKRWRMLDEFGRPWRGEGGELRWCCEGNMYAPLGETPLRCSATDCARAMGVDPGQMAYPALAQSVPPVYGRLVFAQMCMHAAHRRYGVPMITFDESLAEPVMTRRLMARWLRGAGAAAETPYLELCLPRAGSSAERADEAERSAKVDAGSNEETDEMKLNGAETDAEATRGDASGEGWLSDGEFRELYYSHAGGYDQIFGLGAERLSQLAVCDHRLRLCDVEWEGRNTYVETSEPERVREMVEAAVRDGGAGTRATLIVAAGVPLLERWRDWEELHCVGRYGEGDALKSRGLVALTLGRRRGVSKLSQLKHGDVREWMDWRDRSGYKFDADAKAALSWEPIAWEPDRWRGKGLGAEVESMMTEGVHIEAGERGGSVEVPQYTWPDPCARTECMLEADRALAIGQLEYVPDDRVDEVLERGRIHPWTIVQQGEKWRACHDYSCGTNRYAFTAPFGMCSVWDVRRFVKPDSHFVKYDLRDGFFHVPVHPESRRHLVVRHPASGRLMWCARLPFGYSDSPRCFCKVTGAIAQEFRRRVAGKGIHVLVFCDDFLVTGDTSDLADEGGRVLEALLDEFGLQWAPHKQRGPSRCMEFLGFLLCNTPEQRCVALTEKRQEKILAMIDEWMSRRPRANDRAYVADPTELAKLLGHLGFVSQVVPNGRTYLQAMLSQFAGLIVDWKWGSVRLTTGQATSLELSAGFWRDLEWWRDNLSRRNCVPLATAVACDAMLAGTDASDWGTGQLAWHDGQREEAVLEFTYSERRRPVNWRELLGILRVVEIAGRRLQGRALKVNSALARRGVNDRVTIEGDNTASIGAAKKGASKSEDMQELVRRLVEAAELYDLTLHLIHTPGLTLIRPDQLSRGSPMEEPRVRFNRATFGAIEARYGPFTEVMGAERDWARPSEQRDGARSLWIHPTTSTVSSALRLLGERLDEWGPDRVRGVVVVPRFPGATWWRMLKHFSCAGRWEAGETVLQMNQLGRWVDVRVKTPTLLLSFPRAAGALPRPMTARACDVEGYRWSTAVSRALLGAVQGSFLYQPRSADQKRGVLYYVWESFNPLTATCEKGDTECVRVCCAELLSSDARRGHFQIAARASTHHEGGSFHVGKRGRPPYRAWRVDVGLLWSIDAYVSVERDDREEFADSSLHQAEALEFVTYACDLEMVERDIQRTRASWPTEDVACFADLTPDEQMGVEARQHRPATRSAGVDASERAESAAGASLALSDVFRHTWRCARANAVAGRAGGCDSESAFCTASDGRAECVDLSTESAVTLDRSGEGVETMAADLRALECDDPQDALDDARAAAELIHDQRKPVDARREGGRGEAQPVKEARYASSRTVCQYPAMKCDGCNVRFEMGRRIVPGGRAMVHDNGVCRGLAEAKLKATPASGQADVPVAEATVDASKAKRDAARENRFGTAAIESAWRCLQGECGVRDETRVMCMRGCGRGVHVSRCCGQSANFSIANRLVCVHCRVTQIIRPDVSGRIVVASQLRVSLVQNMIAELQHSAAGTARGHADFAQLERRWQLAMADGDDEAAKSVCLPRHSEDAFVSFVQWLVLDADRVRSFPTTMRSAGAVMTLLETTDFTKTKRCKAIIKRVVADFGVEPEPMTHATRRLVSMMLSTTIAQRCKGPTAKWLATRTRLLLTLLLMGGLRVGESTGEVHGLRANDLALRVPLVSESDPDGLGETCELKVGDSKTGHARYVGFVAKSRGPLAFTAGDFIREMWASRGFALSVTEEHGMRVTRPDFWVVQVKLSALPATGRTSVTSLMERLKVCCVPSIMPHVKWALVFLSRRAKAIKLADAMRVVNVAGGARASQAVRDATGWLAREGYGAFTYVVPGPLVCSVNSETGWGLHPLEPQSTYDHLVGALKMAYESSKNAGTADPELDLMGMKEPKFGTHSFRRMADRVAQEARETLRLSKDDVDAFFGWLVEQRRRDMQTHYAGLDLVLRLFLCKITMML